MSDTNRVSLFAMKEDTWGTTPTDRFKTVRLTGESIGFRIGTITSNELRADRQVSDLIQTSAQNDGGFNYELSYGSLDQFLQAALFSSGWVGVGGGDTRTFLSGAANKSISLNHTTGKITLGSDHGTCTFKVGQTVRLFGSTSDDREYTVTTVAGTGNRELTVTGLTVTESLTGVGTARLEGYPLETITSGTGAGTLDIVIAASPTNTITLGSSITHSIVVGQWIRITGAGSATNKGFHLVTNVAGNVITCGGSVLAGETLNGATIGSIKGAYLRNGVTRSSFTLEKKFEDLDPAVYAAYTGMVLGSMTISLEAGAVFNGSFTFLGKSAAIGSTTVGTTAAAAASTTEVMNATSDLAEVREGGTVVSGLYFQNMQITLENNLRGKPAIGVVGNSDVGAGRFSVTGSVSAYFSSSSFYQKYINGTETSFSFRVQDNSVLANANAYVFDFPRVKFSNGNIVAGGADGDVMADMEFQAILDDTLPFTMQVCRFAA